MPEDVIDLQREMNTAFSRGVVGSTVGRTHASTTPTTLDNWASAPVPG